MAYPSIAAPRGNRRWVTFFALALLPFITTTGCQSTQRPMIAHLPPPTFEGPKIVARPATPPKTEAPLASATPSGPRAWVPNVPPRPWRWIVIHHSASPTGSMAVFDKEHKAKGWDGVGYHFVIGNGTNTGDGQIEVTPRWPIQKWGAHAKTLDNRFNEYGIGICLVGNFDQERPTPAQMKSLATLVAYLMQTYHIPSQNVLGHRDTKPTDCPGRWMNVSTVRQLATRNILTAGGAVESDRAQAAAGTELLNEVTR